MHTYLLIDGEVSGPFDEDDVVQVQETARTPYPVAYIVHDNGVVELPNNNPQATVCGTCGRGWDDSIGTAWTPAPAGRCPFEYEHPEPQPYVNSSGMWLVYIDANGDRHYQHWGELMEAGTLIDPETADDMDIVGWTTDNP